MTEREAIEQVRRAVEIKGSHPQYHDEVMRRHRAEWPVLWRAIDDLLAVSSDTPQETT